MTELKRINRLLTGIERVFHQVALGNHLSDSAMHILYTISYFGEPCPIREIVSSTGISKQTINSALRKLESEGILYLQHNGGREKQICLTPASGSGGKNRWPPGCHRKRDLLILEPGGMGNLSHTDSTVSYHPRTKNKGVPL